MTWICVSIIGLYGLEIAIGEKHNLVKAIGVAGPILSLLKPYKHRGIFSQAPKSLFNWSVIARNFCIISAWAAAMRYEPILVLKTVPAKRTTIAIMPMATTSSTRVKPRRP